MTDIDVDKIVRETLEANLNALGDRIKRETKEQLEKSLKWTIDDIVSKTIRDYIKQEIAPIIKMSMEKQKDDVIKGLKLQIPDLSKVLGEIMAKSLEENMKNSWDRDKVIKALFGLR